MPGAARESKAALVRSPVRYGDWIGDGRAGKQVSKRREKTYAERAPAVPKERSEQPRAKAHPSRDTGSGLCGHRTRVQVRSVRAPSLCRFDLASRISIR